MTYADYLKTDHWQHKRAEALAHYRYKCMVCGSANRLNVHHRNYAVLGRERMQHLLVLCGDCHKSLHQQFKINSRQFAIINDSVKRGWASINESSRVVYDNARRSSFYTAKTERRKRDRQRQKKEERGKIEESRRNQQTKIYNSILGTWSSKPA